MRKLTSPEISTILNSTITKCVDCGERILASNERIEFAFCMSDLAIGAIDKDFITKSLVSKGARK